MMWLSQLLICTFACIHFEAKAIPLLTKNYQDNCTDVEFSESANKEINKLWGVYRLGDIIGNKSTSEYRSKVCDLWPKSIACQYLHRTTEKDDIKWLSDHNKQHKFQVAGLDISDFTILHMRLGDVMHWDVRECWESMCINTGVTLITYVFQKSYYEAILPQVPRNKPILVVANPYHKVKSDTMIRNLEYLRLVVCFFREKGFTVGYFGDGRTPDEDFTAMIAASTFVQGGGGYSRLAAQVVKSRGGQVIFDRTHPSIAIPPPPTRSHEIAQLLSTDHTDQCSDVKFSVYSARLYARSWRLYSLGAALANSPRSKRTCIDWPKSIACQYLKHAARGGEAPDKNSNFTWLSLVDTNNNSDSSGVPMQNLSKYTVVHLRLGGGVMTSNACWEELCVHADSGRKKVVRAFPRSYYEAILPQLPRSTQAVVVVASPYFMGESNPKRHLKYLRQVVCFFREKGFTVAYFGDGRTPDEDFTAMIAASTFVQGGGGYSRLAAQVVKSRGGRVIFDRTHPSIAPYALWR